MMAHRPDVAHCLFGKWSFTRTQTSPFVQVLSVGSFVLFCFFHYNGRAESFQQRPYGPPSPLYIYAPFQKNMDSPDDGQC